MLVSAAPNGADEFNMDFQKCSGANDTCGHFSSANTPMSLVAPNNFNPTWTQDMF